MRSNIRVYSSILRDAVLFFHVQHELLFCNMQHYAPVYSHMEQYVLVCSDMRQYVPLQSDIRQYVKVCSDT